jgi:hypothetical protein
MSENLELVRTVQSELPNLHSLTGVKTNMSDEISLLFCEKKKLANKSRLKQFRKFGQTHLRRLINLASGQKRPFKTFFVRHFPVS